MDEVERVALERSASRGDQLANYRLGRTATAGAPRYSIGSIENVWGPVASYVHHVRCMLIADPHLSPGALLAYLPVLLPLHLATLLVPHHRIS